MVSAMKEAEVLEYAMAKLQPHQDKLSYWRNNTGALPAAGGYYVRFGHIGGGDIEGFISPNARFFAIETKRPSGGKQRESQIIFEQRCRKMGGLYFLTPTKELVDEAVKEIINNSI